MTYQEAVDYIESIPGFAKKNPLSHTRELLRRLGDPQDRCRIIHVAGTNGKGSVCAFLNNMLQMEGGAVGLFTSPHLAVIRERFRVNDVMISEEDFTEIFERVMVCVHDMEAEGMPHPAYFELLLAMGFAYFADAGVKWLILETGLGGLRDATNVIEHPAACIITSISLDHTEFLGSTIAEIAFQKAGIIKEGVPVICDANVQEAAAVILQQAQQLHAPYIPCYAPMADIKARTDKSVAFVLNNRYYDYVPVTVSFPADYQVMNALLAMTALRQLVPEARLSDACIAEAVQHTKWPGRMEAVAEDVIVDGAHNEDGIAAFVRAAARIAEKRPVSLLFAAVMEKEYAQMIRRLCEGVPFQNITVTQIEGHRKVDAGAFAQIFREFTQAPVYAEPDIRSAYAKALAERPENGILLCAGSLYLVGEIEALTGGTYA